MKTEFKRGREYLFQLPKSLYQRVKKLKIDANNINIDFLLYLVYFINNKSNISSDNDSWVVLHAKYLQENYDFEKNHIKYTSKNHLDFLVENNILERKKHYVNKDNPKKSNSKKYKIQKIENQINKDLFEKCTIKEKGLVDKIFKKDNIRRIIARQKNPHLTKWLDIDNNKLEIDVEGATNFIKNTYTSENDSQKKEYRLSYINNFAIQKKYYSRDGKDDRFHSIITNMPKDLKPFVTFGKLPLFEVDIKNSQPFILHYFLRFLEEIANNSKENKRKIKMRLEKFFKDKVNNDNIKETKRDININKTTIELVSSNIVSLIIRDSFQTFVKSDIVLFHSLINNPKEADIYSYVAQHLLDKSIISITSNYTYSVKLYNEQKKIPTDKSFDNLRDCGKAIVIQSLYSSTTSSINAIREFKALFPTVNGVMNAFKKENKKHFPIIMQRIEAKAILDYCTKNIAKYHNEMPLFTKHDSIITTCEYAEILEKEINELLQKYFNEEVKIGSENWNKYEVCECA